MVPELRGRKVLVTPWKVLNMGTPRGFLMEHSEKRLREQRSAVKGSCSAAKLFLTETVCRPHEGKHVPRSGQA